MENNLNKELGKLDAYLNEPLDDEIDEGDDSDQAQVSHRSFIDGNTMTIADCNMLPKLNMIRVRNYIRIEELTWGRLHWFHLNGLWRHVLKKKIW